MKSIWFALIKFLVIFLLICSFPSMSLGIIVKCESPVGKIMYSNSTCPQGYKMISSRPESRSYSSSNDRGVLSNNTIQSFEFDGFYWHIRRAHRFRKIGKEGYYERPLNDYFFVIEATVKNISSEPRYVTNDMKLISRNNQYETSSTAYIYSEYQLGYENKTRKIEPGIRVNIFFGFDVKAADRFTLIISEWGFGDNRISFTIK